MASHMTPLRGAYPVLCSERVSESRDFYVRHFGFQVSFDSDWYVSLKHSQRPEFELAVVDARHVTVPEQYRRPVAGLLLNFEVENVDVEYQRLIKEARLPVLLDIKSEEFGQRHFITADPNGVMIDVITPIPPSPEFASQYLGQ
jgi:catechol 2,3-dioxygenase-like lactoylglutathione lyase family enzyme